MKKCKFLFTKCYKIFSWWNSINMKDNAEVLLIRLEDEDDFMCNESGEILFFDNISQIDEFLSKHSEIDCNKVIVTPIEILEEYYD